MNGEPAYEKLYKNYRETVYAHAYAITHSTWHAEEIVQDVFLRVWLHREKLAAVQDMKAWLFIITKRLIFDYIRKKHRQQLFFTSYKYGISHRDDSDALLPLKCQRLLDEAQSTLTPRERQVFYLRHVKGMGRAEIAKRLNIAEATAVYYIKNSMSLVRRFVYEKLEVRRA